MMNKEDSERIRENLIEISDSLPENTRLCVVTKYHDLDETKAVIANGFDILGENKVQDLVKKMDSIDENVRWHFIGHLQTNKVKYLIDRVSMIESVDSVKLLRKINNESAKKGVKTKVLIQYNLTGEDQKFGFSETETEDWIKEASGLDNVLIKGLMGMGPHTDNTAEIRNVFRSLKAIYDKIKSSINQDNIEMEILSMGMSGDYPIAVEEGSNLVRIGSKVFS